MSVAGERQCQLQHAWAKPGSWSAARRGSLQQSRIQRRFAVPLCALVMHSLKFCVLFHCFFKNQLRCRCKKGIGCYNRRTLPPSLVLLQWWWCCEVLPRKHRTEPKIQLNWCPVALARIVIACRRTPSIHCTENSRNFPFLNKMIYSSLSYRKETMGKEDQVCQEQCIPFISVFSLTRKKCIIITERN